VKKILWVVCALALGCGGGAARVSGMRGASPASAEVSANAPGAPAMPAPEVVASQDVRASAPAAPGAPPSPPPPPSRPPATAADVPHSAAMLIYTANLSLAVFQVEQGLDAVERIARDTGGYLSTRQDAEIGIRVPRDRFDEAIRRVEALGDVLHRDIRAADVTDEYVDLEARLKNAYAMRARLQDLLTKASVQEALAIETQLGRVTEEIERFEGKLKLLRDKIAFSSITVSFAPVADQPVRDTALLPFSWLQDIGLASLLHIPPRGSP